MKVKVTFAVTLSESGQRNALIAGTNAATKQTVVHELDPTDPLLDRKSTRLNSSHIQKSRMPSSA